MLADLGWRSLKNRHIDSQLVMLYKIVHGYVAIDIQPYFEKPQRYTRHIHPLSFRQIHTKATYYQKAFYPATIVLWNRLPTDIVLRADLDSFFDQSSIISSHNFKHCFYPVVKPDSALTLSFFNHSHYFTFTSARI